MISRRNLLYLFLAGGLAVPQGLAHAKDGRESSKDDGGAGGDDDGGDDDGGNDDGGDDDGGDDDGGDDDGGDDDGGDDDGGDDDQDRALDAVRNNHAASLKEILSIVRKVHDGEIVNVSLSGSSQNLTYHIKLLDRGNRLIEVQIDALSRQIVHIEGT